MIKKRTFVCRRLVNLRPHESFFCAAGLFPVLLTRPISNFKKKKLNPFLKNLVSIQVTRVGHDIRYRVQTYSTTNGQWRNLNLSYVPFRIHCHSTTNGETSQRILYVLFRKHCHIYNQIQRQVPCRRGEK